MQHTTKPVIIITGANGFIGSYLVDYFLEQNFQITALVQEIPEQIIPTLKYQKFDLNDEIPEEPFSDADYLIHCAYVAADIDINAMKINIAGTKRLLELARKHNLKKFVFISSFSAHEKAVSAYGKSKFETEKLFDPERDLVLKPGLVVGNGGLFQKIATLIQKSNFVPMIDGGRQMIQTLYVGDLAKAIEKGIKNNISGIFPLAEILPGTMKDLYQQICKKKNKNPVLFSIPFFIANAGIAFFSLFGIKTPVSKENLLGLKWSQTYDIAKSVETFEMNFVPLKETLKMI
jgi:nucleoside-diphosphate-sugar epimerase